MNSFVPPKRKIWELLILLGISSLFYFIYPSTDALVLFIFGFIWNWAASIDLSLLFENRRYRFSLIKMVFNLQQLILKPFLAAPEFVKRILSVLPAGIFWSIVIIINQSDMPWWGTFLGSAAFELMQVEINFIKKYKETK